MASSSQVRTDRELLARIGRSAGGKAGYKQLVRELGLGGGRERRVLLEQLGRMVERKELVKLSNELWAVPKEAVETASNHRDAGKPRWDGMEAAGRSGRDRLVSGRLDLHRDGFGFVRPDEGGRGISSLLPMRYRERCRGIWCWWRRRRWGGMGGGRGGLRGF